MAKLQDISIKRADSGACLDMITDRISTTILCIKVINKKPNYSTQCYMYIFFDLLSHFMYFVSMTYEKVHHKSFDNLLMRIYYNDIFLKVMCVGSELFFLFVYASKKATPVIFLLQIIVYIKTLFHIMHLYIGICILSKVSSK